jgi:hypothetical protein
MTSGEIAVALVLFIMQGILIYMLVPFLKSYGGKRGEILAIKEGIETVLSNLRRIQTTTEQIRADASYRVWDRQMRWTFKKDLYVRLLESLGQRLQVLDRLIETVADTPKGFVAHLFIQSVITQKEEEQKELLALNTDLNREIQRVAAVAGIALSAETAEALSWISTQLDLLRAAPAPDMLMQLSQERNVLQKGFDTIAASAKRDIGTNEPDI